MSTRPWRAIMSIACCITITAIHPRALFGPTTHLAIPLIALIRHVQKRIFVASYLLTSKQLVGALCDAKKRGANVQIITDRAMTTTHRGRQVIAQLKRTHIPHFIFYSPANSSLMHHKFAVIDEQVWTGSMNWTRAGTSANYENVVVLNAPAVVARFAAHFTTLKRRTNGIAARTRSAHHHGVFFLPDDHKKALQQLMNAVRSATSRIYMALYELTSKTMTQLLIEAAGRGVQVSIVYDTTRAQENVRSTLATLRSHKTITCTPCSAATTLHHKFAVIDNCVWTGSMNWTRAGMYRNQECILTTRNPIITKAYTQAFLSLRTGRSSLNALSPLRNRMTINMGNKSRRKTRPTTKQRKRSRSKLKPA